ncbi:hypothetical protein EMIT0P43_90232 [Pseudomonas jessenii]
MLQHRQAHGVVTLVGGKAQALVGFNGVGATVLQLIGADLVQQTNAPAFLTQVEQYATTFAGDGLQGGLQLRAAVATLAEQGIARQAFGVQPAEYRGTIVEFTQAQHNVLAAGGFIEKAMHGELRKRRWQLGSGDKNDRHRCAPDLKV